MRTLELSLKQTAHDFAAVSATLRCVYTFGKVDMMAPWWMLFGDENDTGSRDVVGGDFP